MLIVGGMGSPKPQKHMLPPGCLKLAAMQLSGSLSASVT